MWNITRKTVNNLSAYRYSMASRLNHSLILAKRDRTGKRLADFIRPSVGLFGPVFKLRVCFSKLYADPPGH